MKYLVTGGAGFIGSHLVDALLAQGADVVVLDNLSTGLGTNLASGASLVRGDVGDISLLGDVLPGCAAVFHLAAVSSVQASLDQPLAVHGANLTATLALLEAARRHGVKRLVFSSSAAVYGDTHGEAAREDMVPRPLSHYAVQKLASEHYCAVYAKTFGLETVCLRYFNVFGPRQRDDSPYSGVIARFLAAARAGHAPTIFGDGRQTRDFCPVADVVGANLAAAHSQADRVAGRVFNIGTGRSIALLDVIGLLREVFPAMPEPLRLPPRAGEILHSRADIRLACDNLGYEPQIPFAAALGGMAKAP